jgi:hypothetical protein
LHSCSDPVTSVQYSTHFKDVFTAKLQQSLFWWKALNRVGLTRTSLTICEDGRVITLVSVLQDLLANIIKKVLVVNGRNAMRIIN